jgi:hypothetical protein
MERERHYTLLEISSLVLFCRSGHRQLVSKENAKTLLKCASGRKRKEHLQHAVTSANFDSQ